MSRPSRSPPVTLTLTPHRQRRTKCLTATRRIRPGAIILDEFVVASNREITIDENDGPQVTESREGEIEAKHREQQDRRITEWIVNKGLTGNADDTYRDYSLRRGDLTDRSRYLRRLYNGNIPFLHHSCTPNATLVHGEKTGRVYARRTILEGDEVTIAYGPESIETLETEYGFKCHCSRKCFRRSEGREPTLAEMRGDHRIRGSSSWKWQRLKSSIKEYWCIHFKKPEKLDTLDD